MDKKDNKGTCTACSCPCEAHKEHNHPISAEGGSASGGEKKCEHCGNKHDGKNTCSTC